MTNSSSGKGRKDSQTIMSFSRSEGIGDVRFRGYDTSMVVSKYKTFTNHSF